LFAVEKLKIIEALRGDLVGDESSLPNMVWHETELKETEEKFMAGDMEVLNCQQAKKECPVGQNNITQAKLRVGVSGTV